MGGGGSGKYRSDDTFISRRIKIGQSISNLQPDKFVRMHDLKLNLLE